ncbi:oligosaccharide repeat unit polymerase [Rhodococcus ruber]|uniref:O-antigen polymerase n=1 Tax=Rhodococcus TaxID=1827 RepID=UPI000B303CC6|nr:MULTISPECIES: O-antigen polymerase [Rhodococcus]UQB71993.1 oligosaccharide repeat unit polymerase [Rhodococcus ruber]WKK10021.1 O-antigen polymerase [Rhodococcus ruber]WML61828.1 O-antigen polymerase [Rhodococcus sp. AH-ZY2]
MANVVGLVNAFICLLQIARGIRSRDSGPITLTFWSFSLVWLCVAPLAQLDAGRLPWPDSLMDEFYVEAQLITTVALLSFVAGKLIARRTAAQITSDGEGYEPRVESGPGEAGYGRMWIPFAMALVLALPVLAITGGVAGRFATRDDVGSAFAENGISAADGDTIQLFLLNRLPAAAALVAAYAASHYFFQYARQTGRGRGGPLVTLVLGISLVLLLANPFSSSRYIAFGAIAAVLLAAVRIDSAKRRLMFAFVCVVGLLFVYPLATWFKRESVQSSPFRGFPDMFFTVDYDGYQQLINSIYFVDESGHTFGKYVLSAGLFFIPRALWAGKANPASIDVADARGYSFQNLSLPIWSEFYIDFGIVGVIAGLIAFGFISGRLDLAYYLRPMSTSAHMCVLVAVCMFGFLRGPLGAQVIFMGSVVVIGYIVYQTRDRAVEWKNGVVDR